MAGPSRNSAPPLLDGSWERPGRNPAIGSLVIVLVLGSIYFLAGNLSVIGVFAARAFSSTIGSSPKGLFGALGSGSGGDFAENMRAFYAQNRMWILAVTDACQYLVFLLAGLLISKRSFSSDVAAYSGYRRAPAAGILVGLAGAVLVLPVVDAISRFTDSFFPTFSRYNELNAELYRWSGPAEAAMVFFSVALTPAICEEAIFRGIFQRGLQRRLAFPWSFVCSGVVFAVFHQSALSTPALVPVGMLLGFLYWAYDSIWVGMALHAAYNGVILVLSSKTVDASAIMDGNYFRWPIWLAGACGLAILCFFTGKRALARKGAAAMDGGAPIDWTTAPGSPLPTASPAD